MKPKTFILLLFFPFANLNAGTEISQMHITFPYIDAAYIKKNGNKQKIIVPTTDLNSVEFKCKFNENGRLETVEIFDLIDNYFKK